MPHFGESLCRMFAPLNTQQSSGQRTLRHVTAFACCLQASLRSQWWALQWLKLLNIPPVLVAILTIAGPADDMEAYAATCAKVLPTISTMGGLGRFRCSNNASAFEDMKKKDHHFFPAFPAALNIVHSLVPGPAVLYQFVPHARSAFGAFAGGRRFSTFNCYIRKTPP